ncbi:isopentenyl-diphosphate delta-isomerase [Mucilaginibacter gossypiicola]|uniref:Isopentenyl-diphosphate delta-isomerase n=1 Tax=Mucilaginibacter gossypiicola TaxID=551995 RepID=A0A1H8UA45_9SPHI|nr:isopentenyl-diphosphate Delta-isomerase [Mucilaginibacter gossypiicola]SEP00071.1 isopentenyl-diphosphate delta-isomerase [Mucilaginibacter gossypiicola]
MEDNIIIVDTAGNAIGEIDKMEAHISGTLHRAFSVFVFNSKGQLLLQRRDLDKYHSGGLWTNTCCSHPRAGETTQNAAHRRLQEEMGMDCELTELFQFSYRHEFANGLIENEYDHVFMGISDELPLPNPAEVAGFRYIDTDLLIVELLEQPEQYTAWFKICLEQVLEIYRQII